MTALLLGRTMIGERVWDTLRAIDAAAAFDDVDSRRVEAIGHSGGATTVVYASAIDDRIQGSIPSCYVCNMRDCIATIDHCEDNYLPGALRWFEMGDIAGLMAPRPMLVVAGRRDPISESLAPRP